MAEFSVIKSFRGYENKKDETNISAGTLIKGSKNVVSTDGEKVSARQGYTVLGAEGNNNNPVESSFEWQKLRVGQVAVRCTDGTLQFWYSSSKGEGSDWSGDDTWRDVETGLNSSQLDYTAWHDSAESDDTLLFVDGSTSVFRWSGAFAEVDSVTSNTITKKGSESWAERGALTSGTRKVTIDGTDYTYTGGETTDTLTGVTPDPSANGVSSGDLAVQTPRETANVIGSGYSPTILETLDNHVFYATEEEREVHMSKNDDFTDFTSASPRIPGDGIILTFDQPPQSLIANNAGDTDSNSKALYVSAGRKFWYQVFFNLSSDLQNETVTVTPLKSAVGQAAKSKYSVEHIKNYVGFITQEPTFEFLGNVQDLPNKQSRNISDRIKNDFDALDFYNADIRYYKNNVYIALPREDLVLVYNLEKGFWEAPWELPAQALSVIEGDLCFHSNATDTTYKMFDGRSDNGSPINAVARFSYLNYGDRVNLKNFTEDYAEGNIGINTTLERKILYDFGGATRTQVETIDGSDDAITFGSIDANPLGSNPLGKEPLGSSGSLPEVRKFRTIFGSSKTNFFEMAVEFSSNQEDSQWEVLAYGIDVTKSSDKPIQIKQ